MRFSQRAQDACDDLVGADPGRVDRDVRSPVVGLPGSIELLDLRHRAPLEHRPVPDPTGSSVQLPDVTVEKHDGAELAQELHAALAARRAAARGDAVPGLALAALQRVGLEVAEPRPTCVAEDLGDGAALGGDDHLARLDEAAPETAREQTPADRLSGPHEPHENDVTPPHPR